MRAFIMILAMSFVGLGPTQAIPETPVLLPDLETMMLLEALITDAPNTNHAISPASITSIIGMAAEGAAEQYEDAGNAEFQPPRPRDGLTIRNAIWFDEAVVPRDGPNARLRAIWNADIATINLSRDGQTEINTWVHDATEGRVGPLLQEPLDQANIALANALTFKDAWQKPFHSERTVSRQFYRPAGDTVDAAFITSQTTYPSWQTKSGTWVRIPFLRRERFLLLFLPEIDLKHDPTTALDMIVDTRRDERLEWESASRVTLSLPKVAFSDRHDLHELLKAIGKSKALDAGISGLADPAPHSGPVVQGAAITWDEHGADVAAATVAVGSRALSSNAERHIAFDRQFFFFIIDPIVPNPLVAGSLTDPR